MIRTCVGGLHPANSAASVSALTHALQALPDNPPPPPPPTRPPRQDQKKKDAEANGAADLPPAPPPAPSRAASGGADAAAKEAQAEKFKEVGWGGGGAWGGLCFQTHLPSRAAPPPPRTPARPQSPPLLPPSSFSTLPLTPPPPARRLPRRATSVSAARISRVRRSSTLRLLNRLPTVQKATSTLL